MDMMKRMRMGQMGYDQANSGYPMWNQPQFPQPWGFNPYYPSQIPAPMPAIMHRPVMHPMHIRPPHVQQQVPAKPAPVILKADNFNPAETKLSLPSAARIMKKLPIQYFRVFCISCLYNFKLRFMDDEPPHIPAPIVEEAALIVLPFIQPIDPIPEICDDIFEEMYMPQDSVDVTFSLDYECLTEPSIDQHSVESTIKHSSAAFLQT